MPIILLLGAGALLWLMASRKKAAPPGHPLQDYTMAQLVTLNDQAMAAQDWDLVRAIGEELARRGEERGEEYVEAIRRAREAREERLEG